MLNHNTNFHLPYLLHNQNTTNPFTRYRKIAHLIFLIAKSPEKRDSVISKGIAFYFWLGQLAFGKLKLSQVRQNGEHNIGSCANPGCTIGYRQKGRDPVFIYLFIYFLKFISYFYPGPIFRFYTVPVFWSAQHTNI